MYPCPSCGHENPDGQRFCGDCGTGLLTEAPREERKVITALFCDLVGSTALGERLDHEDVDRLLRSYHGLCRRLIEGHGGVVEKFIGDAVVGVFGVPAAHEDDPERAVRAALRIVDEIVASDLGLEVRIGVNTGEALVHLGVDPRSGEGFATGDCLNTAARLEAAAPVMGVAVGETTQLASAHAIAFEGLPPIDAKGKAEPVPAWRALHPIARVGTPERDRTPFIGRDIELSMLTQLFDRAASRLSTEFVTIVAEPGLGKSRLVRELGQVIDERQELVRWREGRCLPYGDGVSFWPLGEIVKAEAGILDTDDQRTIADKLTAAVSEGDEQQRTWMVDRLAPLVGLSTETAAPQRDEAFTAWRRFLESLTRSGPVVLVVEDLHWADDAFVAFLEHVADKAVGVPLLIVVTARPEVEERHPSWPPGRRSTVLSLAPLEDRDLAELVTAKLTEATPDLMEIVLERAGGSPLYAEQLAAMLQERALPIAGGALDAAAIPHSVQSLIAARIDALPSEPRRVLMEASVVGKTLWSGAVAAMGKHDDLDGAFEALSRREFLRPVRPSSMAGQDEFEFWHALVRDVAYAEITRAERSRMHATTARWIVGQAGEALGEEAEIVVYHLDAAVELGAPGPDDDPALRELLVTALIEGGAAAMRAEVPRAIGPLDRARSLLDHQDPRIEHVLLLLGRAHRATGGYAEAAALMEDVIERALAEGRTLEAVTMATDLSNLLWQIGQGERGDARVRAMKAEVPSPSPAMVEILGWEAVDRYVIGDRHEAADLAEQASDMARDLKVELSARVMSIVGLTRMSLGDPSGAEITRAAAERALADGDAPMASRILYNRAGTMGGFDLAAQLAAIDEVMEVCERYGMDAELWSARAGRLAPLAYMGRFREVLDDADAVLAWAAAADDAFSATAALSALAVVEAERGGDRVDPADLAERGRLLGTTDFALQGSELALARGDVDLALELLREPRASPTPENAMHVAIQCAALGLREDAATMLAMSEPSRPLDRHTQTLAQAMLASLDADHARALELYGEAFRGFDEASELTTATRAREGLGRSLLALGRPDEGKVELIEARTSWEAMGATRRVRLLDDLLAAMP